MSTNDEDIDKQVVDQLYWYNSVKASEVAVTVDHGFVTLNGTVPSYNAKYTASDDAYLVSGVKFVDNKLTVDYSSKTTDMQIKDDVESSLDWDIDLDAQNITVSVDNGTVTLLGSVDSYWKRIIAEMDTRKVNGVQEIKNELAIVTTGRWEDKNIATEIESALDRNLNVDVNDVDVKVRKGNVTLTGEMPSWTSKNSAYDSAIFTTGVKEVHNNLTIA
jgi:osmotically-inducible protein OsmY